jgi:F0F1-type ATP synthase assembly protein I
MWHFGLNHLKRTSRIFSAFPKQFVMSGRDKNSKNPKKPSYRPLTGRITAMGSSGWEAYTVGFTLVGCIVAGAGMGYFLDYQFKTSYWLPILFLLGVIGGFREMFLTLKRVDAEQKRKRAKEEANRTSYTPPSVQSHSEVVEPEIQRERIFKVPPPPIFGDTPKSEPQSDKQSVDELIQRLLDDNTDESDKSDQQSEPNGSDKKF